MAGRPVRQDLAVGPGWPALVAGAGPTLRLAGPLGDGLGQQLNYQRGVVQPSGKGDSRVGKGLAVVMVISP